jgi:hypothetical protein
MTSGQRVAILKAQNRPTLLTVPKVVDSRRAVDPERPDRHTTGASVLPKAKPDATAGMLPSIANLGASQP